MVSAVAMAQHVKVMLQINDIEYLEKHLCFAIVKSFTVQNGVY